MNTKSLIIVGALFVATSLLQSCSCPESLAEVVSPSGHDVAQISLDGKCGGATVGYFTELAVRRNDGLSLLRRWNSLWIVQGDVVARAKWLDSKKLELRHSPIDNERVHVLFQTDRFQDIEISYISDPSLQRK